MLPSPRTQCCPSRAETSMSLLAHCCTGNSETSIHMVVRMMHIASHTVFLQAVAKAMALAMTEVSAACLVKGSGYACAAGEAEIISTAEVSASPCPPDLTIPVCTVPVCTRVYTCVPVCTRVYPCAL